MSVNFSLLTHSAAATTRVGRQMAKLVRAGDLLIMQAALGAGKTTFTQGLGAGLGVQGRVTSPTFIIAREHPPTGDGPALIHTDAYRIDTLEQLETLDLDSSLSEAVTVVEWGEGKVEGLSEDYLLVTLERQSAPGAVPHEEVPHTMQDTSTKQVASTKQDASVSIVSNGSQAQAWQLDQDTDLEAGDCLITFRSVSPRWQQADFAGAFTTDQGVELVQEVERA